MRSVEKIPQLRELIPYWNGDGVNTGLKPTDQARRNDHENHNHRNRHRHSNRCPWSCDHCCSRSQGGWCLLEQQRWRRCRHQLRLYLRTPSVITTYRTITEVAVLLQVPIVPVLAVTTVVVDASVTDPSIDSKSSHFTPSALAGFSIERNSSD